MQQTIHPVIGGNLEVIEQLESLLNMLNIEIYCYQDPDLTHSSIGAHTRHILDIYRALMQGMSSNASVDYDLRRRGSMLEKDPNAARTELAGLKSWLLALTETELQRTITVESEVSLNTLSRISVTSNLERELVFASSHFVHHLAIIGILARSQKVNLPSAVGVAPATASYLRGDAALSD